MSRRAPICCLGLWALLSCDKTDETPPTQTCTNISGSVTADGLEIRKPEEQVSGCVERRTSVDPPRAECTPKTPDLACLGQTEAYGTPVLVSFTGCVSSFGLEAQSDRLVVTVFTEREANGTPTNPGYDVAGQPGMQAERSSARVGQVISTTVDRSQCPDRGAFRVDGVPTETPLIVRVTDQDQRAQDRRYVDTYQYNVILRNSAVRDAPSLSGNLVASPAATCGANPCFVVDDVNTVVDATFRTVALAAGVSVIRGQNDLYDGDGQGHLAGEVQDCGSQDTLQNAVVALSQPARKVAYFNVGLPPDADNLEDPKVEGSRTRTNADGLYAAIAIDATTQGAELTVGAAVTRSLCGDDGICACTAEGAANPAHTGADANEGDAVVLGTRSVYVFPDSITILSFDRQLYTKH